jgi:hypothetical protein
MAAAATTAALIAGCGGGGDEKKPSTAPPKAREPLTAAAHRLADVLPAGDCKPLASLMLQSVTRGPGVKPTDPPTKAECRFIKSEARDQLAGYRVSKVQEFGPAGFSDGEGDGVKPGLVLGIFWILDTDGSWKVDYDSAFRPQLGVKPSPRGFATNAQLFVSAVGRRDCDAFWGLLHVGSRFVRAANGNKTRFCDGLPESYRKGGGLPDVAAHKDAKPVELGRTRDLGFYGLPLANGRYVAMILAGPIGGIADDEVKDHANPAVLEFVSVRLPRD